MDSLGGGALTGAEKDEFMEKVKQEIALANFQELLTVNKLCFNYIKYFYDQIISVSLK